MSKRASRKKKGVKRRGGSYSVGELNKLIDDLCHPLFREGEGFVFVDGFLHCLVEQNPPVSVKKFMMYNLPRLLKGLSEKRRKTSVKK